MKLILIICFFLIVNSQLQCSLSVNTFSCSGTGSFTTNILSGTSYLEIQSATSSIIYINNTSPSNNINVISSVSCKFFNITTNNNNNYLYIDTNTISNYNFLLNSNAYATSYFVNNNYQTTCNGINIVGNGTNIIQKNVLSGSYASLNSLITIYNQQISLINNNNFTNLNNFKGIKIFGYFTDIIVNYNVIDYQTVTISSTTDEMAFLSILNNSNSFNSISINYNNITFDLNCLYLIPFVHLYNFVSSNIIQISNNNIYFIQLDPFSSSTTMITNQQLNSLKNSYISSRLTDRLYGC